MTILSDAAASDPLSLFRYFLGEWKGTGSGRPGISQSERTYSPILNGRFILVQGRSVFQPQDANPEGEIHEELGVLSYDKGREKHVLREFHVEGYVNRYVVDTRDAAAGSLVLTTEAIENLPPGWRARVTLEILGEDAFRETFDLAGPGKDWACCIVNEFKREMQPE